MSTQFLGVEPRLRFAWFSMALLVIGLASVGCTQKNEEMQSACLGPKFVHSGSGLQAGVTYLGTSPSVTIARYEEDPVTKQEHELIWEESTSFPVALVEHRHADELYVMGPGRNGELIIERWDASEVHGAYATARPSAGTPIGVDAPTGDTSTYISGGVLVPPAQRDRPTFRREEIYRGTQLATLVSLAVDPEGRFLLALVGSPPALLQLPLGAANPTASVVCTESQFSCLDELRSLYVMDHVTKGRVYISTTGDGERDCMLVAEDNDNDGVFDLIEQLNLAQWTARGYDAQVWVRDFVNWR